MSLQQDFINQIAPLIQKWAPNYGIKVCSPVIAQACLESAYGTSNKVRKGHNYFGLKWRNNRCQITNEWFEDGGSEQGADGNYTTISTRWFKFKSMEDGVIGYFQWTNTPNYANLKGVTNPRTYLENIKADGYATSLKYVENVMRVIETHNLTQYDPVQQPIELKPITARYGMKTNYAARGNYGGERSLSDIQYIVIHYTANDGDTAEANGNYFRNNIVKASAHYFVDDDSVTQSVPDNFIAWSVGGNRYSNASQTGGGKLYGVCKNANSVSIEICDTKKDGKIYPTAQTIANTLHLTRALMTKYNVPKGHVIRHFDVTGKACPAYWVDNAKWKEEFLDRLATASVPSEPVIQEEQKKLYRVQTGAFRIKLNATALQKKLEQQGFNSFVTQVDGLWKVQCGAYSVRANAEAMKTKLMQKGFAVIIV